MYLIDTQELHTLLGFLILSLALSVCYPFLFYSLVNCHSSNSRILFSLGISKSNNLMHLSRSAHSGGNEVNHPYPHLHVGTGEGGVPLRCLWLCVVIDKSISVSQLNTNEAKMPLINWNTQLRQKWLDKKAQVAVIIGRNIVWQLTMDKIFHIPDFLMRCFMEWIVKVSYWCCSRIMRCVKKNNDKTVLPFRS